MAFLVACKPSAATLLACAPFSPRSLLAPCPRLAVAAAGAVAAVVPPADPGGAGSKCVRTTRPCNPLVLAIVFQPGGHVLGGLHCVPEPECGSHIIGPPPAEYVTGTGGAVAAGICFGLLVPLAAVVASFLLTLRYLAPGARLHQVGLWDGWLVLFEVGLQRVCVSASTSDPTHLASHYSTMPCAPTTAHRHQAYYVLPLKAENARQQRRLQRLASRHHGPPAASWWGRWWARLRSGGGRGVAPLDAPASPTAGMQRASLDFDSGASEEERPAGQAAAHEGGTTQGGQQAVASQPAVAGPAREPTDEAGGGSQGASETAQPVGAGEVCETDGPGGSNGRARNMAQPGEAPLPAPAAAALEQQQQQLEKLAAQQQQQGAEHLVPVARKPRWHHRLSHWLVRGIVKPMFG